MTASKLREALPEAEGRFRAFMDASPVLAFIRDERGRHVYANGRWMAQFGKPEADLMGKTNFDLFPIDTARTFQESDEAVLRGGKPCECVEHGLAPDGTHRWWKVVKFPLSGPAGERYVGGMALDITEQMKAEDRLREFQGELAHALRLATLGEMVSILAHEVNQPLGVIANEAQAASRLLRELPSAPPALVDAVDAIKAEAFGAAEVVRGLRGFASKGASERVPVDLNGLVREVSVLLEREGRRDGVAVELRLGELPGPIPLDRLQIQQLIVNLGRNAIDALRDVEPPRRLVLETSAGAGEVLLRVVDNGLGCPSTIRQRMFEPYVTTKPGGLGLGLALCRSIAQAHGGRIEAEPNQPRGMRLEVRLPTEVRDAK